MSQSTLSIKPKLSAFDSPLVGNDNICSSKRKMFVYYQNVRGLRSKLTELYQSSLACNYHIISISETWLNSSVFNDERLCPRYQIFRSDRNYEALNSSRGGGVLLASAMSFGPSIRSIKLMKQHKC